MPESSSAKRVTACVIVIGNEILSGRTQDTNIAFLAKALGEQGVQLAEARVIADHNPTIVATLNHCRDQFDYVLTTGGIGPTHDDITTQAVAEAFGVPVVRHPEAERRLRRHYGDRPERLTPERLKMAEVPEGASLIDNPISAAPGYRLGNVFVLAGVPQIAQAMFDHVKRLLEGGAVVHSETLTGTVPEGDMAPGLAKLQQEFAELDIGSYPYFRNQQFGVSVVVRGTNRAQVEACAARIAALFSALSQ